MRLTRIIAIGLCVLPWMGGAIAEDSEPSADNPRVNRAKTNEK